MTADQSPTAAEITEANTATVFHLQVHLAEDADGLMPFRGEVPARYRRAGNVLEIEDPDAVMADGPLDVALEIAFAAANVGSRDPLVARSVTDIDAWVRSYRERDRSRSLSVGDVVVVNGETGYVVDRIGFRPLTDTERDVLARSAAYTS